MTATPLKVWFVCTGVEIYNRGIESFFRDAFTHLHPLMPQFDIRAELFKGGGADVPPDEHRVWCLPRTGAMAKVIGSIIHRNQYTVEQLSFYPALARQIRKHRPDVIYSSDGNLGMQLWKRRDRIGVGFKLLYSNGAPLHPPFVMVDHVQQVVPCYMEEAMAAGESPLMHSSVPYGFGVPLGPPERNSESKASARRQLGLPEDRPIVISVGWISKTLKRMDYTINEIARLPEPRPFLVMLGARDENTPELIEMANQKLGSGQFIARSVPLAQVDMYYQAADIFVLSSLSEGFGRVYIEALMHGLPVIAHDGPVTRFVLADQGDFADLTAEGNLALAVSTRLAIADNPAAAAARRESVRQRFDWKILAKDYAAMFQRAGGKMANSPGN